MSLTAKIRAARRSDLSAIMDVERSLASGAPWSENDWASELANDGRIVLAADVDDQLAAAISIRLTDVAELMRIVVDPIHRRHGFGTALVRAAVAAVPAGTAEMWLEVAEDNAPALRLYAATGFIACDRRPRYYPGGIAALIMKRELGPRSGSEVSCPTR